MLDVLVVFLVLTKRRYKILIHFRFTINMHSVSSPFQSRVQLSQRIPGRFPWNDSQLLKCRDIPRDFVGHIKYCRLFNENVFIANQIKKIYVQLCTQYLLKYFTRSWPFVWGIRLSSVNSPHKVHWRGALNSWVNNRDTGDWRRHRAHYDVTVI